MQFQEYLRKVYPAHTAKVRLSYARKFSFILSEGNAQELLTLSDYKRHHIMKSLVALSKYTGSYVIWKDIVQRYQLKWSKKVGVEDFSDISNDNREGFSSMLKWLKLVYSQMPTSYGSILIYCTLTGLRPQEAVLSLGLLRSEPNKYLKDNSILEHFRYPQIFIRKTKKAYISIVTNSLLNVAREAGDHSYNAMRLAIVKKRLGMNMSYCRKIFATHLRMRGIEQETIDLLQGRTPKSVFAIHYFRPDFRPEATVSFQLMEITPTLR